MLTRKELKQNAKEQLRGKRAFGVLITLVLFAISWGAMLVVMSCWGIGNAFSEGAGIAAMSVAYVLWIIFACMISTGYSWTFLKLRRGEKNGVGGLFHPFRRFGKVLGANALMFLVILGMYFISAAITAVLAAYVHPALAVICGIAAVVLLCYVMLGFAVVPYLLLDQPRLGVCACIKRSRELMKGHKWELFVLGLSFIGWYFLVGLTCGILSLWIVPYMNVVMANYYDELVRLSSGEKAEPEIEEVEAAEEIEKPEMIEAKMELEVKETEEVVEPETVAEQEVPVPEETEEPEVTEQDAIQEEITEEQESVDEPEE